MLDARAHIGQTCADIEHYDDAVPILRRMESDCMAYLNYVEQNPGQYARGLIHLRDRLYAAGVSLQEEVDGLEMVMPGSRAPSTSDWLF